MYQVYRMMEGETLNDVAQKIGVDITDLENLNSMPEGEYIVIPAMIPNFNTSKFITYTVKSGDSIYSIASISGVDPSVLLRLNGLNESDYIYPNQELLIPNRNISIYITRENDTLDKIANNFNTSIENILEQNPNLYLVSDQIITYN